jgi:hypothetical protein
VKYRPVAPDALDKVMGDLKRLAGETVLPWHFDPSKKQFYVEVDGQRHAVTFGAGDAETLLVELLTANLDLLIDAIEGRFVLIDREWTCRPTKSALPGSLPPATESSSTSGASSPPAPSGSKTKSDVPLATPSTASAKKSVVKKRRASAKR